LTAHDAVKAPRTDTPASPTLPPFVEAYDSIVAYRERPTPHDPVIACVWSREASAEPRTHRILPDACVDIVVVDGRARVAGPQTEAAIVDIPAGARTEGVRFRVGAAGAALGLPAAEVLDQTVPLDAVWGRDAELDEVVAAIRRRAERPDPLVRAVATGTPRQRLGIGDRQLRRRFIDAVGYGPKTLERILRFQRFLALAGRHGDLARLAFEAGYADQAHLTRECTRLAGLPPAALLATGAGPAGETSDSFKIPGAAPATMAA